jgi:predicted histone-like DNA-binding protein
MSVQFKMVAKKNNLTTPPKVNYYPCAVNKGEISLDELAKIIASRSSISRADCYGVVLALTDVIGEALSNGNIVRIDSLGTFQLNLHGTAASESNALGKAILKVPKSTTNRQKS